MMIILTQEKSKTVLILFLSIVLISLFALSSKKPDKVNYVVEEYTIKNAEISEVKVDSKKLIGNFKLELYDNRAKVVIDDSEKEYKVKNKKKYLELSNSSEKIKVERVKDDLKLKYNGIDLTLGRDVSMSTQ